VPWTVVSVIPSSEFKLLFYTEIYNTWSDITAFSSCPEVSCLPVHHKHLSSDRLNPVADVSRLHRGKMLQANFFRASIQFLCLCWGTGDGGMSVHCEQEQDTDLRAHPASWPKLTMRSELEADRSFQLRLRLMVWCGLNWQTELSYIKATEQSPS